MPWGPAWARRGWWGRPWADWWPGWWPRGRGFCWRLAYEAILARSPSEAEARLLEDYRRELEYELEGLKRELEFVERRLRELRGETGVER